MCKQFQCDCYKYFQYDREPILWILGKREREVRERETVARKERTRGSERGQGKPQGKKRWVRQSSKLEPDVEMKGMESEVRGLRGCSWKFPPPKPCKECPGIRPGTFSAGLCRCAGPRRWTHTECWTPEARTSCAQWHFHEIGTGTTEGTSTLTPGEREMCKRGIKEQPWQCNYTIYTLVVEDQISVQVTGRFKSSRRGRW